MIVCPAGLLLNSYRAFALLVYQRDVSTDRVQGFGFADELANSVA